MSKWSTEDTLPSNPKSTREGTACLKKEKKNYNTVNIALPLLGGGNIEQTCDNDASSTDWHVNTEVQRVSPRGMSEQASTEAAIPSSKVEMSLHEMASSRTGKVAYRWQTLRDGELPICEMHSSKLRK